MSVLSQQSAINTNENFWDSSAPLNTLIAVAHRLSGSLNNSNTTIATINFTAPRAGFISGVVYASVRSGTAGFNGQTMTLFCLDSNIPAEQVNGYVSVQPLAGSTNPEGCASLVYNQQVSAGQSVSLLVRMNSGSNLNTYTNCGYFFQFL